MDPSKHIQDIQVLRAVASVMVIFQHISLTPGLFANLPGTPTMPFHLGVEMFFVISGFVVTRSLFRGNVNVASFLIRRFYRLTPAMLCFVMFSLIVFTMIAALSVPPPDFLRMTGARDFLIQSVTVLTGIFINVTADTGILYYFSAMWSLSVEYQFYFGFAFVVGLLKLIRPDKATEKLVVGIAAAVLLAVLLASRLLGMQWSSGGAGPLALLDYIVKWRFDFLLYGVVLALATDRFGAIRLPARRVTALAIAGFIALPLALGMVSEDPLGGTAVFQDTVLLPVAGICFMAAVALASGQPAGAVRHPGPVYRLFTWLGDRSYTMYLYHFPVLALIWCVLSSQAPSIFYYPPIVYGLVQAAFTFGITIFLADLTFRHVEMPGNTLGRRIANRVAGWSWRRKPAQPTPTGPV